MLPLPIPPGRGVWDWGVSWVLVRLRGHPVQFFQLSLASQLSSILSHGSAIMSENALEQGWKGLAAPRMLQVVALLQAMGEELAGAGLMGNGGSFPFPNK